MDESNPAEETSVEDRLSALEARCTELERRENQGSRALFLYVIAIYAVFGALLMLHWAGHVMRHDL